MMIFAKKIKYLLFLLLAAFLSFGATLIYAPVYDYADWILPKKYFIIENLRNGILPLWNPYQSLGMPEHIDVNLFYLPTYILSLFGNYNPVMWGVEEVLYAFIAGIGFFKLSKQLGASPKASFVMSVCYLSSGVFIGNTQHFAWIIGMVWMPFVMCYFIRLLDKPAMKTAILLAVFGSLLITGAYQAFIFILLWLFVIILIFHLLNNRQWKDTRHIRKLILFLTFSGVVCIVLSLPYIVSILYSTDFIIRGKPVAYEKTFAVPFTLRGLSSLLFPYIACSEGLFTKTDISMGSIFIGVINLFFCGLGFKNIKSKTLKIIVIWGFLCGLISLGKTLPVHQWVFYTIPLFNHIRVVAIFRIWFMLSLLILAVMGWNNYLHGNEKQYKKPLLYFIFCITIIYVSVLIFACIKSPDAFHNLCTLNFDGLLDSTIWNKFAFSSAMEIIIMLVAMFILWRGNQKIKSGLLISLICIEMIITSWLCLRYTGFSTIHTNKELSSQIDSLPKDYPIPTEITDCNNIAKKHNIVHLWQNLGMITKDVEYGSYNPLYLIKHQAMLQPFEDAEIPFKLNAIAFFPNEVIYNSTAIIFSEDTAYTSEIKKAKSYSKLPKAKVEIEVFKPGNIVLHTQSTAERPLIVAQNNFNGWKAKVEGGKELTITTLNTSLISFNVPQGEHTIRLYYHRTDVVFALLLAAGVWMLLIGVYIFQICRNHFR